MTCAIHDTHHILKIIPGAQRSAYHLLATAEILLSARLNEQVR